MKMKKNLFIMALLTMSMGFVACNDDEEEVIPEGTAQVTIKDNNIDVTPANVTNWGNYALQVASLLAKDANDLNQAWASSYKGGDAFATTFKNHGTPYTSYNNCVEQIIDGCIDIAGEVGDAKIGEPRDLWEKGNYTEAVYAVESWYSFHSIEDYSNNIQSIRNAFNGSLNNRGEAAHSIASYLKANNNALYVRTKSAIDQAFTAVAGMKAPFRSYIGSSTVLVAMNACAALSDVLDKELKPYINNIEDDEALKNIVNSYVDNVVLPTYANLVEETRELANTINELAKAPSTETFKVAARQWIITRAPWETSEAFLFGPVAELGLDPNMDSWPLDVDAIKGVLTTGDFSKLNWTGEYNEEDENIEAAQTVRGFHTLEFLLFKDGNPRTYNK